MSSRKPKTTDANVPAAVSRFQKFEAVTIHRSQIKNAAYNPRVIDAHARKKLKEKIKQVGLVETLVWNKRSGNLVGGHQRIGIMDELEGSPDYRLTVAQLDLDDKTEKQLNAFLNNPSAQGNYELDGLKALIDEVGYEGAGFDFADVQFTFGTETDAGASMFAPGNDKAKKTIDEIKEIKDKIKRDKSKNCGKDDAEFYAVVIFQTRQELDGWLEGLGLPVEERYVDGRRLQNLMETAH